MGDVIEIVRSQPHRILSVGRSLDSPQESLLLSPLDSPNYGEGIFAPTSNGNVPQPVGYFHPDLLVCGLETPRTSSDTLVSLLEKAGLKTLSSRGPRVATEPGIVGHPGTLQFETEGEARSALTLLNWGDFPVVEHLDHDDTGRPSWWRFFPTEVILLDAMPKSRWQITYPPTLPSLLD